MTEKSSKFKAKSEVPYQNKEGQVKDINAAFVEAEIINNAMKNGRRILGLIGPSKKTMQKAEIEAEKAGKMENIRNNNKIKEENKKERREVLERWEEDFEGFMQHFNQYFQEANEISINILREGVIKKEEDGDRQPNAEELIDIRDLYSEIKSAIEELEALAKEGINQFRPDHKLLKQELEDAKNIRNEASNLILNSEDTLKIADGFHKMHEWRRNMYEIRNEIS